MAVIDHLSDVSSHRFSEEVILILNTAFHNSAFAYGQRKKDLAKQTNLTESQVQDWFRNQRRKNNKMKNKQKTEKE